MMIKKSMNISAFILTVGFAINAFAYNSDSSSEKSFISQLLPKVFVEADILYWKAAEDGLEYIRFNQDLPADSVASLTSAEPKFDWDPGFRLGVGYNGDCDAWYSALTWTHYNTKADSQVSRLPSGPGYLVNTRSLLNGVTLLLPVSQFTADAEWKLAYNTIDLEVGAPYVINQRFVATPFMGLRGAFINQKFNNTVTTVSSPGATIRAEQAKNDFNALGVRAGVDTSCNLGSGFGVYLKAAASVVYGKFKIFDSVATTFTALPSTSILGFEQSLHRVRANLEGAFGAQWTQAFNNNQSLTVRLGYELVHWFDQNQFPGPVTTESTRSSSLGLQGLQLTGRYDF